MVATTAGFFYHNLKINLLIIISIVIMLVLLLRFKSGLLSDLGSVLCPLVELFSRTCSAQGSTHLLLVSTQG